MKIGTRLLDLRNRVEYEAATSIRHRTSGDVYNKQYGEQVAIRMPLDFARDIPGWWWR